MINVGDRVFYAVDGNVGLYGTAYEKIVYGTTNCFKLRLEKNDIISGITVEESSLRKV